MSQRDTIQEQYPYPESPHPGGPYQGAYQEAPYQDAPYPQAPYADDDYQEAFYPEHDEEQPRQKAKRRSVDAWMAQKSTTLPRFKRRSIALFFLRLPAFVPWFFILRGWLSLNAKDVLTLSEADVLGTGGEAAFLIAVSITPLLR